MCVCVYVLWQVELALARVVGTVGNVERRKYEVRYVFIYLIKLTIMWGAVTWPCLVAAMPRDPVYTLYGLCWASASLRHQFALPACAGKVSLAAQVAR